MQGYCVKCKEKREIKDPVQVTMKNGRPATQGTCPVCATKIFKIGKAERRPMRLDRHPPDRPRPMGPVNLGIRSSVRCRLV